MVTGKVVEKKMTLNDKDHGYDCCAISLSSLWIISCCIFLLCLCGPGNEGTELKNNLVFVRSAEWILSVFVYVNRLFEYPCNKRPLWFMKYSEGIPESQMHSEANLRIYNRPQQTKELKQWPHACEWDRPSQGDWSIVDTSPCRLRPIHLQINQQENALVSWS